MEQTVPFLGTLLKTAAEILLLSKKFVSLQATSPSQSVRFRKKER
jgi:hypothetical protein